MLLLLLLFAVIVHSKCTKIHGGVGRAGLLNYSTQALVAMLSATVGRGVSFSPNLKVRNQDSQQP